MICEWGVILCNAEMWGDYIGWRNERILTSRPKILRRAPPTHRTRQSFWRKETGHHKTEHTWHGPWHTSTPSSLGRLILIPTLLPTCTRGESWLVEKAATKIFTSLLTPTYYITTLGTNIQLLGRFIILKVEHFIYAQLHKIVVKVGMIHKSCSYTRKKTGTWKSNLKQLYWVLPVYVCMHVDYLRSKNILATCYLLRKKSACSDLLLQNNGPREKVGQGNERWDWDSVTFSYLKNFSKLYIRNKSGVNKKKMNSLRNARKFSLSRWRFNFVGFLSFIYENFIWHCWSHIFCSMWYVM